MGIKMVAATTWSGSPMQQGLPHTVGLSLCLPRLAPSSVPITAGPAARDVDCELQPLQDRGQTSALTSRSGGAAALTLAGLFVFLGRRAKGSHFARGSRRARRSVGCRSYGEKLGRGPLLRASWWPFPLRGRQQSQGTGGVATADPEEEDDGGVSPEEELLLLKQTGPQRVAMLGTRECPYQHQQEIELLSEARVNRGDHVFTSGSSGTNSSVIKGALKAQKPHLLTVILPQSLKKQDKDAQILLRKCMDAGVDVQELSENDKLPLQEAARRCNTNVLARVKKLVAFASHESSVYLSLIEEAKRSGIVATAFFMD